MPAMIEMIVSQVTVDPDTGSPLVILKSASGNERLAIWIAAADAGAISTALAPLTLERPMTHDLLCRAVDLLGGRLERVEITGVVEDRFAARLCLKRGARAHALPARASDAIALAMRAGAPIRVARKVIVACEKLDRPDPALELDSELDPDIDPGLLLASLSDEEFGKWKM